ncbi:FAD-dependent oxidoreductase [Deinococcus aquiradiocola]|uniref:FAD-dependent oxidoreductase n=1 Tax=Deinococcus aquiradiocola TaxID=393059 RepID=A0A917PHE4_9DEIO|nr:FAD-dependent oxidoreductase [Deinococcus aquiradiocola]GGJ78966.1 FAD-dependent oxidoreductase [Deinococcus aquiradiocola]
MTEFHADLLIIGAGLGGVAASLSGLRLGRSVLLTEETDWIGGQLTAQAVPPDESLWIEESGCTASYRALREGIRRYYRQHYPLTPEAHIDPHLNPGAGNVSRLCHEPRVAVAVLEGMLAPYLSSGQLRLMLNTRPVSATTDGDRVTSVQAEHQPTGTRLDLSGAYVLDATETGELLELAGIEHVIGAESQNQTGEPHALAVADPLNQQAISWCFAMDHTEGADYTIPKPAGYDGWRTYRPACWPTPQLSWTYPHPITLQPVTRDLFSNPVETPHGGDLWHYRRIVARRQFTDAAARQDITVVNWPQIDYLPGPILGVSAQERERHLQGARDLSLSLLYWMQTEAPRHDGRTGGYPGLRLRGDVTGTAEGHGLAKSAYIREARRIQAEFTVLEQHVGVEARGHLVGAEVFPDSVGVGQYRIDLHPSTRGRNYVDVASWPFQIPLGALIPVRAENLLPSGKSLGVTHITNGCYRLHPVEWNIGEAAGALAAFCMNEKHVPRQVRASADLTRDFQRLLTDRLGFQLQWPEALRVQPSPGF